MVTNSNSLAPSSAGNGAAKLSCTAPGPTIAMTIPYPLQLR